RLSKERKHEQAATEFIQFVDANPTNRSGRNEDALIGAADAYRALNRFGEAVAVEERLIGEYPKSSYVGKILYRTALTYRRWFEFDKAIVSFQRLITDPRFANSPDRSDAIFNAATILGNTRTYGEAAKLFRQYASLTDPSIDDSDRAEALYRAGLMFA